MLLSVAAMLAVAQTAPEMRLMRNPTIFEDKVVFNYAGDLWECSADGGMARRLTSHPGAENFPRFSPDGKWIAFTASYDGAAEVYVMPSEGGDPKRLTFEPSPDIVKGWTPDGKILYVSDSQTPGSFSFGLRTISPNGGLSKLTGLKEVFDVSMSADGKTVAFSRNNSHTFNWRRYRGGTQGRIAFSDLNASTYKEIPSGRENRWMPNFIGDRVYYIGDKTQGTRNIWMFDTKSNRETQVTTNNDGDIRSLSTDGKRLVFEREGQIFVMDPVKGTIAPVVPRVAADMNAARPRMYKYGNMISDGSLSPSGLRIAIEARGEIFSVPARSGETRNIGGNSASKETNPAWSPDGKTIAFMSDRSGEMRIYTMPQMGGDWKEVPTPKGVSLTEFRWSPDSKKISFSATDYKLHVIDLETGKVTLAYAFEYGSPVYDWSPDSNWIAVNAVTTNLFGTISLFNYKTGKLHKVTDGYFADSAPTFDLNGKYLYFISQRTFNPTPNDFEFEIAMTDSQRVYAIPLSADQTNPLLRGGDEEPAGNEGGGRPAGGPPGAPPAAPAEIKIDFDGIAERAIPLPWPAGSYSFLFGVNNGVLTWTQGTLKMFSFNNRASMDIISGAGGFAFNPSRTKMGVFVGGGVSILDVAPGQDPNAGRVNVNNMDGMLDPRAEWTQIYWEAWRWNRDRFYDPKFLGLDWKKMGDKYATWLPYVKNRADLNWVLSNLASELGTGHAYVQGGDMGPVPAGVAPTGLLGADYEVSGNEVRFKTIYRGLNFEEGRRGPLGDPGVSVKEGDVLVAIDGQPVGSKNPNELLVGKVARTVKLTVKSGASTRVVTVRPIDNEDDLRYISWVEGNRKKVAEMSGGKIGYMHVPNTSIQGMLEFAKGFYSQKDKEAIVIDERYNGGGMIPTFFIDKLMRRQQTGFIQRNGGEVGFPAESLDMPKAMLVNEFAGSGGDMFPWLFRENKLGPLIGNRTWGGLVGIQGGAPLVDGGNVTAPSFGIFDIKRGQWIAENTGVDPDIQVDLRPDLVAQGRDPQLEKAVEYLMGEIKKGRTPWKRPAFPRVPGAGGGK
jgi:tricorn protease